MDTKILLNYYRQNKLLVWPILSGLSSIIILVLVIFPQMVSYVKVKDEISKTTDNFGTLQVKAQELEQIDEVSTKQKLGTAFTVLPAEQDVPKSAAILETLIKKSALELKNISFVSSSGENKDSFLLNITVSGPIKFVRDFILGLRDSPQIFQVQSINVRFQQNNVLVDADIPLAVFYEAFPKSPVSSSQPSFQLTPEEENFLANLKQLTSSFEGTISAETADVPLGKVDPFE